MHEKENKFIIKLIETKAQVTVFLINGIKLSGVITENDESTLYLQRDQHTQLVYKNAISTIMPIDPVSF
ncbi:MAG: RNA chaperone Hfq [Crocinitomicaceae bacterium TMED45]|jgi:host factor-I protein|nr:MAG: RNA chaperone Hfq [Crocinitomicaceae bacterium TMED45]|tara:strand:+ start:1602 stop:1808 length:207 start_codon:yes stop_codon:yes gene_type:complete